MKRVILYKMIKKTINLKDRTFKKTINIGVRNLIYCKKEIMNLIK